MINAKDIPLPKGYSRQTGGAWRKGFAAFINRQDKETCPYQQGLRRLGRFGIVYKKAWLAGWKEAEAQT